MSECYFCDEKKKLDVCLECHNSLVHKKKLDTELTSEEILRAHESMIEDLLITIELLKKETK